MTYYQARQAFLSGYLAKQAADEGRPITSASSAVELRSDLAYGLNLPGVKAAQLVYDKNNKPLVCIVRPAEWDKLTANDQYEIGVGLRNNRVKAAQEQAVGDAVVREKVPPHVVNYLQWYKTNVLPYRNNKAYQQDNIVNFYSHTPDTSIGPERNILNSALAGDFPADAFNRWRTTYSDYLDADVTSPNFDEIREQAKSTGLGDRAMSFIDTEGGYIHVAKTPTFVGHEGGHGADDTLHPGVTNVLSKSSLNHASNANAQQHEPEIPAIALEEKALDWAERHGLATPSTAPTHWLNRYMRTYGGSLPEDPGQWREYSTSWIANLRESPAYRQWLKYHSSLPVTSVPKPNK